MAWPTALVVSVALAAIVVLKILGADTSDLTPILLLLLGGLGAGELRAIKEQSNGNNTLLHERVAEQGRVIADLAKANAPAAPPPSPPDSAES